ncbi:MAG: SPFH domain-containing protein [Caldilineaceae bacterium]
MSKKITELMRQGGTQMPTTADLGNTLSEVSVTAEMLRTEADRINWLTGFLGFGRRVLVPADEIHAAVGDGIHSFILSNERKIFGKSADRSSFYWLNPLTRVIKLKTISFTVPIRGYHDDGVQALDNSKVSFRLWAHAVAKLNPEKADVAAQRVGVDTTSLLNTITKVGMAELVAAAASMPLEEIIANRQLLAEIAFPKVNKILAELGYDLALLTVTELGGEAYQRLVEQAEARVSKETSIATNLEQIAEIQDRQARERTEAEIKAKTDKKLAAERLEAEREVNDATLAQQEALTIRRHQFELSQVERKKGAAQAGHEANLLEVQLTQKLAEADAVNQAELAKLRAEREAELRALEQKRLAALRLAETEAKAEQDALAQMRQIAREAERTQAEAKRLREEELAAAERTKEIVLLRTSQAAEALKLEADAQAGALRIQTDAETKAELVKAEAEATATEKRAQAAKVRAEATRPKRLPPAWRKQKWRRRVCALRNNRWLSRVPKGWPLPKFNGSKPLPRPSASKN